MNKPLVSVIVPVYNTEKYLPRCVKSILGQTYYNLELLLVDDGSTDRSGQVCEDYAAMDSRVKVICKNNGGVSSARNAGIDNAKGEFIVFVDSDDWIDKNALEYLMNAVQKEKTEIVMMSFDNRNNKVIKAGFNIKCKRFDINTTEAERWKELFAHGILHVVWGKIYFAEIIKKHNIRFNPQITYGEDTMFLFEYLTHCEKIFVSNEIIYHYNKLNDNAATRKYHVNLIDGIIAYHTEMESFVERLNLTRSEKSGIMGWCAVRCILNLIYPYVYYLPEEQALINIEMCLARFEKWIATDDVWKYNEGENSGLVNAIFSRNIRQIYTEQQKMFEKTSLKQIISTILYKILRPLIEKKRDGLIKHNFNKNC